MTHIPTHKILIGGEWRSTKDTHDLFDPSTGDVLAHISLGNADDVDAAVKAAQAALDGEWGALTALERGRILARIGRAVEKQTERLATLEAQDVGKPYTQALADAKALARYLEFYAGAADKIHGETIPYLAGYTVYTLREPFGVTGHIIPWNYPMQMIGRSVVAALAMGNATVLKPAEDACLTAIAFGEIAQEAGLPAGALNIVTGLGEVSGDALSRHPGVNHISFTGSVGVGGKVQQAAAEHSVPVTLELGGKSPQIVFDDADIDKALPFLINASIQNAGQTCSAGSRILAHKDIYDTLLERLAEQFRALRVGPALLDLNVGPLVSAKQKSIVDGFRARAEADGLTLVAEGQIVSDAPKGGYYTTPTLWANVPIGHEMAQKEIFGPAQVIIPFETEQEAVEIANGTEFGLVAGVWTKDGARQMRLAKALKVGQVFINNYGAGGGVELPFGGMNQSGHGREKGLEGLYSFSTVKTIAVLHE
jgi:aldehyde dehydrogenase (NAD+)